MNDQLSFDFTDWDDPRHGLIHVMMPNMRYACGGCICGCQGPSGHFVLGTADWQAVTCPDCLAPGQEALRAECRRQQDNQA